jgi:UPF0716 protein FxsA
MWLLLAFIAIPLIEIALFIQVGGLIGLWPTLAIVILTALLGTWLLRMQGAVALADLRRSLSEVEDPSEPLAHGAMILFAGALLLTPGFFTDVVGFCLLTPPVRRWIFIELRKRVRVARFETGPGSRPETRPQRGPEIIEGDYEDLDPQKTGTGGHSGWTKH